MHRPNATRAPVKGPGLPAVHAFTEQLLRAGQRTEPRGWGWGRGSPDSGCAQVADRFEHVHKDRTES